MESGDEDEINMSSKDWQRIEDKLYKEGYREGIESGKEKNLQKYCDMTVAAITPHAERIGRLIGNILFLINNKPKTSESNPDLLQLLNDASDEMMRITNSNLEVAGSFENKLELLQKKWDLDCETLETRFRSF